MLICIILDYCWHKVVGFFSSTLSFQNLLLTPCQLLIRLTAVVHSFFFSFFFHRSLMTIPAPFAWVWRIFTLQEHGKSYTPSSFCEIWNCVLSDPHRSDSGPHLLRAIEGEVRPREAWKRMIQDCGTCAPDVHVRFFLGWGLLMI